MRLFYLQLNIQIFYNQIIFIINKITFINYTFYNIVQHFFVILHSINKNNIIKKILYLTILTLCSLIR